MGRSKTCIYERPDSGRMRASIGEADGVADTWNPLSELMSREPDEDRVNGSVRPEVMGLCKLVRSGSLQSAAVCLQDHLDDAKWAARGKALNAYLRYCWHGAVNPWEAMKRLLAVTRAAKNDLIHGISGTETAMLLGETRAAEQARRKNVVEALLQRWGVKGFLGTGGTKSLSARKTLSDAAKGNHSRAKGERRKRVRNFQARQNAPHVGSDEEGGRQKAED